MRKLVFIVMVISFVSCKSSKNEWNKDYLTEKCKTNATKDKEATAMMTGDQIDKICDCSVDKLLAKYKSEAELNGDKGAADAIGSECATSILMPPGPDGPTDTTTVVDTTGMNQ